MVASRSLDASFTVPVLILYWIVFSIVFYLSVCGNSLEPPHQKPSCAGIAPGHILASMSDVPDYRWLTNSASKTDDNSAGRRSSTDPAWQTGGLRLSELLFAWHALALLPAWGENEETFGRVSAGSKTHAELSKNEGSNFEAIGASFGLYFYNARWYDSCLGGVNPWQDATRRPTLSWAEVKSTLRNEIEIYPTFRRVGGFLKYAILYPCNRDPSGQRGQTHCIASSWTVLPPGFWKRVVH